MITDQASKLKGYSLAILGALFWGVSGTLAQYLFQHRGISPEWLVTVRLIISGILLLVYSILKKPESVMEPWRRKGSVLQLLSFGLFGMLAVQYTYFAAIKNSNAATATILQFIGPVFIACYYALVHWRLPQLKEIVAIALALVGTFLIVTHGSLESLSISGTAFFWGIGSAIALATYSIIPAKLMEKFEASVVVGWGMLIGGIAFSFLFNPFELSGVWDIKSIVFTLAIILFGTAIAFFAYLVSVKLVGATVASLLACAEPLSAAVISVVWLKVSFGIYDWLGTGCIILTIILLTLKHGSHDKVKPIQLVSN